MLVNNPQYKDNLKEELFESEIRSLESLANNPRKTDITTQLFGLSPLQKSVPGLFNNLIQQYKDLLDITLSKNPHAQELISNELNLIGDELGTLKAGPNDVLEIHCIAIREKSKEINFIDSEAFSEKARLMVLELMVYLVSYYRKHSLLPKPIETSKTPIKV